MAFDFSSSDTASDAFADPRDVMPSAFQELQGDVSDAIAELIASGGGPEWQGPLVAPISEAELDALRSIRGLSAGDSDTELLARGVLDDTLEGRYLSPDSNPFLRSAIEAAQRPVREAFDEQELLDRALFTRSGQRIQESSPYSRARSVATRGYLDNLADIATNIAYGNYERERSRQDNAVRESRALAGAMFERNLQNLQAQALPRLIEDMGIQRGLEEFRRRVAVLMQAIGAGGTLSNPTGTPVVGSTGSSERTAVDLSSLVQAYASSQKRGG